MNDKNEKLTIKDAYLAMIEYLDQLQQRTNSDDLAGFLGGMVFMSDGVTMDPASWEDWLDAVESVTRQNRA